MPRRKPLVIVTRRLPEPVETRMMELFDTRLSAEDRPMTADALRAAVAEAEVLVPTVTDRIDAALIEAAGPQLKLIANFGTGYDHIDVSAAARRGITVTNTPGVLAEDTADMAMALILSTARRLTEGERLLRSGQWQGWAPTFLLGTRLAGKRLGIIGLGRIGLHLASRARAFGLSIHYHNRHRLHSEIESPLEATYWESLDQMLARVDIVSVHCPHTPATYHLLSQRRLALMKRDSILVNTARGEVVDEAALVPLLDAGHFAGIGLDVHGMPPRIDPQLLRHERVLLSPHIGSATKEARIEMGERVIISIRTLMDGHKPKDRILPAFS